MFNLLPGYIVYFSFSFSSSHYSSLFSSVMNFLWVPVSFEMAFMRLMTMHSLLRFYPSCIPGFFGISFLMSLRSLTYCLILSFFLFSFLFFSIERLGGFFLYGSPWYTCPAVHRLMIVYLSSL